MVADDTWAAPSQAFGRLQRKKIGAARRARRGRLVLIGDHLQMAPIVHGDYKDSVAASSVLQLARSHPAVVLHCSVFVRPRLRAVFSCSSCIWVSRWIPVLDFDSCLVSISWWRAVPQVRCALEREPDCAPPGAPPGALRSREALLTYRKLLENHRMAGAPPAAPRLPVEGVSRLCALCASTAPQNTGRAPRTSRGH